MSSDTVVSPNTVSESRSGDKANREASGRTTENERGNERKRSYSQIIDDSILDSFYGETDDDDIMEGIGSDEEDSVIVKEHRHKKPKLSNTTTDTNVAKDEPLTIDSDDLDSEESEKEEIEILSETKLDKAELLRREQQFKKLTCPVCLDSPDVVIATQCGHLFCCDCIIRALASSKSKSVHTGICPVCRKNVRYKDLQVLSIKHLS